MRPPWVETASGLTFSARGRTVGQYMRKQGALLLGLFLLISTAGCSTTYYKTMEMFGREKRDLLKSRVKEARDEQQKTAEQFKDALTRLRELYGSSGTDLEDRKSTRLNSSHRT